MISTNKLNIAFTLFSTPYTVWKYYEKEFRKLHNVITIGNSLNRFETEQLKEYAAQNYYFYNKMLVDRFAECTFKLTKPCEILTDLGNVDSRDILKKLPFKPDLFIWTDSYQKMIPTNLEYIKCPKIAILCDTHIELDWRIEYSKNFDYVFLPHAQHLKHFKNAGIKNVYWLPYACDPDIHIFNNIEKSYDITFIGSTEKKLHKKRNLILSKIIEKGFDLRIDYLILEEMALAYSRSRIVFNRSINNDINMRIFEGMCSGSLVITNRLTEESCIQNLFQNNIHLHIYDDPKVYASIRHFLQNTEKREQIALSGKKEVLDKHTYKHRVLEILNKIQ